MASNVEVPGLGESVTQAILLRWIKKDGETVRKDEPVCELETDKANVDLPAPATGVLRHAHAEGDTVAVGEVIARVEESAGAAAAAGTPAKPAGAGAAKAAATSAPPTAGTGAATNPIGTATAAKPAGAAATAAKGPSTVMAAAGTATSKPAGAATAAGSGAALAPGASRTVAADDLSPSVRRLVEENKLDASAIPATGPGNRITKEDVQNFLGAAQGSDGHDAAAATRPATPAASAAGTPAPRPASHASAMPGDFDARGERRVPMTKIRQAIAATLVRAQHTAAMLTTFNEVDMTAILDLRARFKERFTEVHGVGLGFMSFFARAVVAGLREFPGLNAYLDGSDIVYHQHVNLGVAVSTERGLAVPVLRSMEHMSFATIEAEIKRLAAATRDAKLNVDELSGGTFTITNGGIYGSLLSTPILNPPQSGILGMHAIQKRPMAINDKVEIRPMMNLALSYDHRLVDGREAVSFLVRVKQSIEDPTRLMLEV